jgi:50S ribosomal subunit-associated GTPase HflX
VFISATRSINMASLEQSITTLLDENATELTVTVSHADHDVIAQLHDLAEILEKRYDGDSVTVRFRMNKIHAERLQKVLARVRVA